jgi:16S rRNA processing protein RimM
MNESELIAVAAIGKPQGLKGFCHLFPIGATLSQKGTDWYRIGRDAHDTRAVYLEQLQGAVDRPIGRFRDVNDREQAELLRGQSLFVPREQLPDLDGDEFYHFELEGMQVYDQNRQLFGTVVAVYNYPTIDAIEVKRLSGDALVVIPLDKHRVPTIDKQSRCIHIDTEQLEELL